MPRKRWIKLWTQETLYGTTSEELLADEQACWFKLLALAGDSPEPGRVEVAPGVPMTDEQIAGILKVPIEVWLRAKDRLQHPDVDKIFINRGIIHIKNWDKYQGEFDKTEYMREYMREYRQRKTNNKTNSKTANSKTIEQNRGEGRGTEDLLTTTVAREENLAKISSLYEDNIGRLTPTIAERLKDTVGEYEEGWFEEALKEAVSLEHRNLKYISAILERWKVEGFKTPKQKGAKGVKRDYGTHQRGDKESSAERLRQSLE
ncbi:hypothetical protein ES703_24965 [subsurface metagenome]